MHNAHWILHTRDDQLTYTLVHFAIFNKRWNFLAHCNSIATAISHGRRIQCRLQRRMMTAHRECALRERQEVGAICRLVPRVS